ncbi:MAG: phosphoribosyl-AMP cyclohydrolase [Spirochaetota bacterium]
MADMGMVEESDRLMLDFGKLRKIAAGTAEVLPVVVQDATTLEVLLIAYVNAEALRLSVEEGRAIFYSTSRQEIWRKGDTSGDTLSLKEIRVNCEQNSLLFLVDKAGKGACHTRDAAGKTRSNCYYRRLRGKELLEFVRAPG